MRHEGITAAVNTAMGAIRLVVAEHENRFEGSGNAVVELLGALGEEHGHRAVEIAGLFLARAAAAGFENLARAEGDPVEDVLAQYQEHVETNVDFTLIVAGLDEDDPPAAP
ncbi:hypothetical protein ACQPWY_23195 [Pseudonocardia xinjiangensis]|uniref:hypothetical protein n=1 Tax=Pseudonocardia xinjiangensis TaxID=75289 RepID=UPI003D937B62